MELFTVASCVAACSIVYAVFKITADMVRRHLLHKRISKFGAPPSLPFIGSAHLFLGSTSVIMNRLIELAKAYPSLFPLWMGSHLAFGITAPEYIQAICRSNKTIERSAFRNFLESVGGIGLITAPVENWRVHRPVIQPIFTLKNLQSFVRIYAAEAVSMVNDMKHHLDGPEFGILHPHIAKYSLSTICETTMGVNLREKPDGNHYTEMVEKLLSTAMERVFRPWQYPNFIFYRTRRGKAHQECAKYLNDFANNVIQIKMKEHLRRRSQSDAADHGGGKSNWNPGTMTLLDHLIVQSCDHGTLPDEAVRDEVNTMIIAGYDTLANTICFAMLALASNPEIQDKVYQELCEIYGEDDGEEVLVTPEDLTRMQYLERVIKETSRLFPTIPVVPRAAMEDLDIGEITVPKGSSIFLGIIDLHRNENHWPDPMKFDPDRFLPDEVAQRHPFAYLPFGGGIRSCIGMKYAMMSMKTLLATVLRRYVLVKDDIVPVKDLRLKFELLMKPSDPIMLRIERRRRNDTP